jgi:hypothetical protein
MKMRTIFAAVVGCALLSQSMTLKAADRGPSTPEERKQALENIHAWMADPLGPNAKDQFGYVLKLVADVPDITVHICTILDKQPKGNKQDASVLFGAAMMAQTAFVIEHPESKDDRAAEYQAGVEGALRVYELLLQTRPKDRQAYLDDLLAKRTAGTLAQYISERAAAVCGK